MMNVPYVVLKYATLLSFPVNNVVEVVLTTLTAVLKSTNNKSSSSSHLQGIKQIATIQRMKTVFTNTPKTPKQQQYSNITLFSCFIFCGCNTNVDNGNT